MSSSSNPEGRAAGTSAGRLADRLSSTLFLAALAHGVVILGVTFTSGPLAEKGAIPSLNVTLVVDTLQADRKPENAELMADTNQIGGGRAAPGDRPTTTLAGDQPVTSKGDPGAADPADGLPRDPARQARQIVTRGPAEQRIAALPKAQEAPSASPQTAAALLSRAAPQTLAMEIDTRAAMPTSDDRDSIAKATTEESVLAAYLDGWRRRVERIGTVNFPARFRGDHSFGRPTLEVAIAANGDIADIIVRRSSGNSALDQAALNILRLAAPFEPLPDSIKSRYDVLRFAYEWEFAGGETASAEAARTP